MKTFSDNIITPEKQMEAIKYAFEAQNLFFLQQMKKQTRIMLFGIGVWFLISYIVLGVLWYFSM